MRRVGRKISEEEERGERGGEEKGEGGEGYEAALGRVGLFVDAVFGFSFHGEVREEWRGVVQALGKAQVPVVAVDVPSGWDVEHGPPGDGKVGSRYMPDVLASLTVPKPMVRCFRGGRHFCGREVFVSGGDGAVWAGYAGLSGRGAGGGIGG